MHQSLRLGPVTKLADCAKNFTDIEQFCTELRDTFLAMVQDEPAAGQVAVLLEQDDGHAHPYTLIAGAGVTITIDQTLHTITITSP